MKFVFRGNTLITYDPKYPRELNTGFVDGEIVGFDYCMFIPEDFELLAQFFTLANKYAKGEIGEDKLRDFIV